MPAPRLHPEETALIIIDMQEKLLPTIIDRQKIENNSAIMLRVAEELEIPAFVTEHYPKGLGRTVESIAEAMIDPSARVEKTRFSALVEVVDEMLHGLRRSSAMICGIEAHVCVLQTALDLQATGRQCFVLSDAISASQRDQIPVAMRRWEAAGAITTGVMSAMYELMGDANHPSRHALVDLAMRIAQ